MALLRGECEAFRQRGAKLSGLDVYISSNVPKGSGVSSSAAFEVLIGVILNDCFMAEKVSPSPSRRSASGQRMFTSANPAV